MNLPSKRLFIAIEGVDGVGKTTLANSLMTKIPDATYVKCPVSNVLWIPEFLERLRIQSVEAIGYVLATICTSLYISRLLKSRTVICDKYILTTVTAQGCLGAKIATFINRHRYRLVRRPDYTLCLTVSSKAKLAERLNGRGKINANDAQMFPHWQALQEMYRRFPEVIEIDTTEIEPKEVCSQALLAIDSPVS